MASAVIFDWFGTLARWAHPEPSNYVSVLRDLGFDPDQGVIDKYLVTWDGIDHREHSASRDTYLAWTRVRLGTLTAACGVSAAEQHAVVAALLESDRDESMVVFPEVLGVVQELRRRGLAIAVCSNWGWDLQPFLEATSVAPLLDVAVTSAQAGFRKPHPGIYEHTLARLDTKPGEAVFVGDSWAPDILGPVSVGMSAVHIARDPNETTPELVAGAHRIGDLRELLTMSAIAGNMPA